MSASADARAAAEATAADGGSAGGGSAGRGTGGGESSGEAAAEDELPTIIVSGLRSPRSPTASAEALDDPKGPPAQSPPTAARADAPTRANVTAETRKHGRRRCGAVQDLARRLRRLSGVYCGGCGPEEPE